MAYQLELHATSQELKICLKSKIHWLSDILLVLFIMAAIIASVVMLASVLSGSASLIEYLITALCPIAILVIGRLWLWNKFGQEVLTIDAEGLRQNFSYKFWTDKNSYPASTFLISFSELSRDKRRVLGQIVIQADQQEIKSIINLDFQDFEKLRLLDNLPVFVEVSKGN